MSFWDGARWIDEAKPQGGAKGLPPRGRATRLTDVVATGAMIIILGALFVPFTPASADGPSLSLSPASGSPGQTVQVTGAYFPRKARLQLTWDGVAAGMPVVLANNGGGFKATLVVPIAATGSHTIAATDVPKRRKTAARQGPIVAQATFTLVEPGTDPTAPSDTPPPADPSEPPVATFAPDPTGTATPPPTEAPTPEPDPTAAPTPRATPTPTPTPTPEPPGVSRALGVYVHNSAWNTGLLDSYADLVGGTPAMALAYNDWAANGDGGQLFPRAMLDAFRARGITPVVTWEPWDWNGSGSNPTYKLANILAGNFDDYIGTWVSGARRYGRPIYLRFAHEMNGDWYPWGVGVNGNTPAQFVSVWRKIVTMFRNGGADNVRWIWSPNVIDNDKPLTGLYPGGSYVDMTAMDGYNWGTTRAGAGGWRSFRSIFDSTYDRILGLAPAKPIFVAETASTEFGGDKAAWIRNAFDGIPDLFPRLSGVIWFNQNKETNWRVDSSASSLKSYREVARRAWWGGGFP
jgi:beta-mannanase